MDSASPTWKRFWQGVRLPFRAVAFIARHSATWPYVWLPVVLTFWGLVAGLFFGWGLTGRLLTWLWARPAEGWALPSLWDLVHLFLYLVNALVDAVAIPQLLTQPAQDLLSAKVETLVRGQTETGQGVGRLAREVLVSLEQSLVRLMLFGAGQLVLLALCLLPGVAVAYPALSFAWSGLWLANQYLGQTMARHLHPAADTRAALTRVRPLGLGMGLVLAAFFLVPLADLFLVPVGVVTGALLYCDLLDEGLVPEKGRA